MVITPNEHIHTASLIVDKLPIIVNGEIILNYWAAQCCQAAQVHSCAGAMCKQKWSLFWQGVVRLSEYLVTEKSKLTGTAEADTALLQQDWAVYPL